LRQAGLPFNYPKLCNTAEQLCCRDMFDLTLAFLTRDKTVTNDFMLNAPERIIVVTGPNQGGEDYICTRLWAGALAGISWPMRTGKRSGALPV